MNWELEHFIVGYLKNYQRGWWFNTMVGYLKIQKDENVETIRSCI